MLGRVRASSSSSLSSLEMERPPSKIIKHDSLSIYESTLLKLKQGSHCNQTVSPEDNVHCSMETEEAMTSEADCSSSSSSNFKSTNSSKEEPECRRNMSIMYLFSKYKTSQQNEQKTNDKEVMTTGSGSSSSPSSTCSV